MLKAQFLILTVALSYSAQAATLEGLSFPDEIKYRDQKLVTHGIGLRTATFMKIKIFVGAFYAPTPGHTAEELLTQIRPLQLRELYIKAIGRGLSVPGFRDVLKESTTPEEYKSVEKEFEAFLAWLPDYEKDGGFSITFAKDEFLAEVYGKTPQKPAFKASARLGDLLLRIWMGPKADADLKRGFLGK